MVTIQNLEVRFDVAGDDDEAAFADLFNKYILQWQQQFAEQQRQERFSEQDRALGDQYHGESV